MRWVVFLLLAACIDTGEGWKPKIDPKYAREHLLTAVPADIDRFDVTLGDKVIYLGNKIERPRLVPAQTTTITHYWKVLKPIGKGWRPFALVRGPPGSADFMNLDMTQMQKAHPVEKWKAGEIIEDIQPITMRPDWRSPYAFVYVGLIQVGKHGTLDRMATSGAKTQDRAVIAAKLEVDLSRAPPPPGTVHVPRASGPLTIDGMAIDQGWTNAITSPDFVTGEASSDPDGKATARMVWDDQHLYFFISVIDTDIATPYAKDDEPLWKADCVEIFIDADSNGRGYIELQVNPKNAKFDSWFATTRAQPGDQTWTANMQTQVKVRGTAEPNDSDQGWEAEIAIPWAALKGRDDAMAVRLPPQIGDRMRLNVNRVDVRSGNDRQNVSSWKKIGNDWHALDRMLTVVFADPTGSIVGSQTPTPPENPNQPIAPPASGSGSAVTPPKPVTPVTPG